jgi:hypothetical protein
MHQKDPVAIVFAINVDFPRRFIPLVPHHHGIILILASV